MSKDKKIFFNGGLYYRLPVNEKEELISIYATLERVKRHDSLLNVVLDISLNNLPQEKKDKAEKIILYDIKYFKNNLLIDQVSSLRTDFCTVTLPDGRKNCFVHHNHPDCCGETFINLVDKHHTDPLILDKYIKFLFKVLSVNNLSFYDPSQIEEGYLERLLPKINDFNNKYYSKYTKITEDYHTLKVEY